MNSSTHFGLSGHDSYTLANINANIFEQNLDLISVSKITNSIVVAIPDAFVFQNLISPQLLEKIQKKFDAFSIQIEAIDTASNALKRALDYCCKHPPLIGILIWNDEDAELSLSIFHLNEKLFYYAEKIQRNKQNIIGVFLRFLHYFQSQYPDKMLEKYYFIDNANVFHSLIAIGLSLWDTKDEKNSQNLLPSDPSNDYSNDSPISENIRTLKMLKLGFFKRLPKYLLGLCSLIILIWGLLWGFIILQDKRIHHLEKKITSLKSQTESIAHIKDETAHFKNTLSQLESSSHQHLSSNILTQLSKAMPVGVFLSVVNFDHVHLVIEGYSQTEKQIDTLVENLKKSAGFTAVDLKPIKPDMTYPPYRFNFSISLEVNERSTT